jgi:hypothetical protein
MKRRFSCILRVDPACAALVPSRHLGAGTQADSAFGATDGRRPAVDAGLEGRKSARAFSSEKLPGQVFSNMLWAAFGMNRQESGGENGALRE